MIEFLNFTNGPAANITDTQSNLDNTSSLHKSQSLEKLAALDDDFSTSEPQSIGDAVNNEPIELHSNEQLQNNSTPEPIPEPKKDELIKSLEKIDSETGVIISENLESVRADLNSNE